MKQTIIITLIVMLFSSCNLKESSDIGQLQFENKTNLQEEKVTPLEGMKKASFKEKGGTFKVSDVKYTDMRAMYNTLESIRDFQRIDRKIEGYPRGKDSLKIVPTDINAFMAAVHFSYADHRPLIISPDMIWLLICQGFSIHVNENAEKLRSKLVTHTGKKDILITRHDFRKGENNPWEETFHTITDSTKKYFKDDLYSLTVPKFSTTGIIETAAYQVTLMEATKKYYSVDYWTGCGIPEITLEGTSEDWQWIRTNVDEFKKYDLGIWVDNLIPILDEFVNASANKINMNFWENMYKTTELHYDRACCTGWIIKFFPYIETKGNKSDIYIKTAYKPNPYISGDDYMLSQLITKDFPQGMAKFPFKWKYQASDIDEVYDMKIYAGFVGVVQNKETKALRPEISWAVQDTKSPYLGASNYARVRSRKPFDYQNTVIEKKPEKYPIFLPDECKTYKQGAIKLKEHVRNEIKKHKQNLELTGVVKVSFVVTWEGTIADIKITKGTGGEEDKIALKITEELPKFSPAVRSYHAVGEVVKDFRVNYRKYLQLDFN